MNEQSIICEGTQVRVPITNKPEIYATLDAIDYSRLTTAGVSTNWHLNGNGNGNQYVRVNYEGRARTVARLIMDRPGREVIRYRDGDTTNLCRSNLELGKTARKLDTGATVR